MCINNKSITILFSVSGSILSGILAAKYGVLYVVLSIIISLFIYLYVLSIKKSILDFSFALNVKKEFSSVALAISSVYICISSTSPYINKIIESCLQGRSPHLITAFLSLLILPFFYILYRKLIEIYTRKISVFYSNMEKEEKLYFWLHTGVMTLILCFLYQKTSAFSYAYFIDVNGNVVSQSANAILNTDSSVLLNRTMNMSVMGDIRHPLWLMIHLPLSSISLLISSIIPLNELIYPLVQCVLINICLSISTILLGRLIKTKWSMLIIGISYPFLLYGLLFETSQIAACLCIFAIFCVCNNSQDGEETAETMVALAAGYTLTSCVLAVLLEKITNVKKLVKKIINCALQFIGFCIVCGQSYILINIVQLIKNMLTSYASPVYTFHDRLVAFTHSLTAAFIAVPFRYYEEPREQYHYFSYYLTIWNKEAKIEWLGILILFLMILGIVWNYKNRFAQICFLWILYHFFIFVILGYSSGDFTVHVMLYGWAIISLVIMSVQKIFEKLKISNPKIIIVIIAVLICSKNLEFLIELCKYAIEKFPVVL